MAAAEGGQYEHEVEVVHRRGKSRVRLVLDAEAVEACLEKDGTLTVNFREVGSTRLSDLPNAEVTTN